MYIQVGVDRGDSSYENYRTLLTQLPEPTGPNSFEVFGEIEKLMGEIEKYCEEWLSFQSLWDLEMAHVIPRLKTLENWMTMLNQIK